MSVHKSLRAGTGLGRSRSVLTRAERVAILTKDGKLRQGDRVIGLPKTRVAKPVKKSKGKKKEEAAAGGAAAPAAPAAAAPASKAAPAAKAAPGGKKA